MDDEKKYWASYDSEKCYCDFGYIETGYEVTCEGQNHICSICGKKIVCNEPGDLPIPKER